MYIYIRKLFDIDASGKQISFPKEAAVNFFNCPNSFLYDRKNYSIHICHLNSPTIFIDLELQPATDYRFSVKLNSFLEANKETIESGDLLLMRKLGKSYGVKLIKKGSKEYSSYIDLLDSSDRHFLLYSDDDDPEVFSKPLNLPLQQIFYGAPGSGKSNTIKREVDDKNLPCIRTTFHPDSDYSTFVGTYKPTMTKEKRYFLEGSTTKEMTYPNGDVIEDSKIEYRFVKQAFLKAYINAWKLFAKPKSISGQDSVVVLSNSSGSVTYSIKEVDNNQAYYQKAYKYSVAEFERVIKDCWKNIIESDNPEDFKIGTTKYYEGAACKWYLNEVGSDLDPDPAACYNYIMNELGKGTIIEYKPDKNGRQIYTFKKDDDNVIVNTTGNATKPKVKGKYENSKESSESVHTIIANELKGYGMEDFNHAWEKLKKEVGKSSSQGPFEFTPQFLIIEEINRGNCAQIFGDLFQLLDRKNGFSEYPIDADEDIRKGLLSEDTQDNPAFGKDGLQFSPELRDFINRRFSGRDIAKQIAEGKVLVLPPNFYIWATMNTSDQSLFPMDSAFKRRWEWQYMPIVDAKKNWKIHLDDKYNNIDWWNFLDRINKVIADLTTSEDKQLGYFFCQPDEYVNPNLDPKDKPNLISTKRFVDKVIFYLWNDVFKDYAFDAKCCKNSEGKEVLFAEFFSKDGKSVNIETLKQFFEMLTVENEPSLVVAKPSEDASATEEVSDTEAPSAGEEPSLTEEEREEAETSTTPTTEE